MSSDLYTVTNGKMRVMLHPGQTKAWDSNKRQVFIIAGTQSGKTSFMPLLLNREITEKGEGDYLAVTATYDLLKLKFLPEMRRFFEIFGWEYAASDRAIVRQYKPRMFSRIIMRSADAEGGLESATAKAAILDECGQNRFGVGAYEAILRRLSLSRGRILAGTTPYNLGWLKTEIFDRWKAGNEEIDVIQFRSTMNPSFPKEEYYERKKTMPAWKFEMFYNGNFSRPAGLIYDNFDDELHTCPRFAIPASWERFVGMDFGLVNLAAVFYAKEPRTERLFAYRVYHGGGFSMASHVAAIMKGEPRIPFAVGGAKSEGNWRAEMRANGLPVREPDVKEVEVGIDRVYGAHANNEIVVFNDLTEYLDQKHTYARELDSQDRPTEKIADKATFHFLDAERYIIGYLKRKGSRVKADQVNLYAQRQTPIKRQPTRSEADVERMLQEYK